MTLTVRSATDTNKHYFVELDENNHATDCGCKDHEFRPGRVGGCKHIREVTEQVARAQAFLDLKRRFDCRENGDEDSRRCYYEMALAS
jgi:hypothetical protein